MRGLSVAVRARLGYLALCCAKLMCRLGRAPPLTQALTLTVWDPLSPESWAEWLVGPQQPCPVLPLLPAQPGKHVYSRMLTQEWACVFLGHRKNSLWSFHTHTHSLSSALAAEEPVPGWLGQEAH